MTSYTLYSQDIIISFKYVHSLAYYNPPSKKFHNRTDAQNPQLLFHFLNLFMIFFLDEVQYTLMTTTTQKKPVVKKCMIIYIRKKGKSKWSKISETISTYVLVWNFLYVWCMYLDEVLYILITTITRKKPLAKKCMIIYIRKKEKSKWWKRSVQFISFNLLCMSDLSLFRRSPIYIEYDYNSEEM